MNRLVKIGLILSLCVLALIPALYLVSIGFQTHASEPAASLNIGKTETHSSFSSGCTSSSSDNSTFNSRHVLLVADNPHPLSRRIAALLAQELNTNCPQIERLELATAPMMLAEGAEGPDIFLRVDLAELQQSSILSSSLKTTVTGSLGSAPWESNQYTQDATTPPLVNFSWNATLESESTFSGIRTDRYGAAAHSIAGEFAKAICKQIEELSTKFPQLPELPRDFYGPYQPVADFDFLKDVHARRQCSYYGLLTHNQTFWQLEMPTDPVPRLLSIIGGLEAAGWKISDQSLTNTESYNIRARHGDEELEIFRLRSSRFGFEPPEKPPGSMEFIVHYRKPLSRAEREAALEKLFVTPVAIETLLPFQNSFTSAQREKFYSLVEKSPAVSPRACVQIAELYFNRRQTNAAVNMLLCAKALVPTLTDASALESSIEALAKKISPKQTLKLAVTPEICRQLGFLELTNGPQTFERECDLGQPLMMFGRDQRGIKVISLTIRPPQKDGYPWVFAQAGEGYRSTSSSVFGLTDHGDWQQQFTVDQQTIKLTAMLQPDQKRVKCTIHTEP